MKFSKFFKLAFSVALISMLSVATVMAQDAPSKQEAVAIIDVNEGDSGISPQNTGGWCTEVSGIGGSYKQVAYAGGGFNCNVTLTMNLPANMKADVIMYSGNSVAWEETNAFRTSRKFWCGSNITSISVRVTDNLGTAPAFTTYKCLVDVAGSQ